MRAIAVYCGSSAGANPAFAQAAVELGQALAARHCALIYGGSHAGLMGIVADAALAAGGRVIGVIPQALVGRELAHRGLTQLEVVDSMHVRKARMCELADGFIALPGGIGTLEEIVEMFTWNQLGIHHKPCALLNIAGFYDAFVAFLQGTVQQGLLQREQFERLIVADGVDALLQTFEQFKPAPDQPQNSVRVLS
ncbi:MAG: hypothetical protein JWR16_700 [Nevskia sp.]|nr:hypothetical protein [Nevskia sp.]